MPLLCAHCGSAAGSTARLEGDLELRRVFVCLHCRDFSGNPSITSPVGCMQRVRGDEGMQEVCGDHAVAWCSDCRTTACQRHLAKRGGRREPPRCQSCATRHRKARLRRAVRVLPHPRELWWAGVEN